MVESRWEKTLAFLEENEWAAWGFIGLCIAIAIGILIAGGVGLYSMWGAGFRGGFWLVFIIYLGVAGGLIGVASKFIDEV